MNSIWKYHSLLPHLHEAYRFTLGEGGTPLVKSKSIGPALGIPELYFKLENLNPTGSYKDRFAASLISVLNSRSVKLCIATSSGNTGAALAAYCAAARIKCMLAIVDGAPAEKLRQIRLYGASTYMITGFGKDTAVSGKVFDFLEQKCAALGIPLPVSAYMYCPEGMAGVETIAFEIMEDTGNTVNHIFCPAGGGGLTLAVARGVMRYGDAYALHSLPKVHCVQPEGNDTIASSLRNKIKAKAALKSFTTISGLQVPNVLDGNEVIASCIQLHGNGFVVADQEVFSFHRRLALEEGIFCEPAGAVALAGLAAAIKNNEIKATEKVVCVVTGSGFKDMRSVDDHFSLPETVIIDRVEKLSLALTI